MEESSEIGSDDSYENTVIDFDSDIGIMEEEKIENF